MKSILSAVIGATLALSAIEANAQATPGERQVALTIETDTLASALDKWAQQSGFQIFVQDWEAAKNLPARSLRGTFAAQDALEQLLSGTPLTYVWISDKAVSIRKRMPQTVPTALQRTSLEGQPSIPVAKFSGDGPPSAEGGRLATSNAAQATAEGSAGPAVETLGEVVVTGTYIRGQGNASGANVLVVDRSAIERTGYATVQDVLKTIPQNFAPTRPEISGGAGNFTRGVGINLRALGTNATLTLLNGRRLPVSGDGDFVDISTIPTSAIERIEILADGASALYGSDAIAGVVNIILRNDFDGAETQVRYAAADGSDETVASQLLGKKGESGNVLVGYQYYHRDPLAVADRAFAASSDKTAFGGTDFRDPFSNPGNIVDLATFSPIFAVPTNQNGVGLTPADFVPGSVNLASGQEGSDMLPENETHAAWILASKDWSERLRTFVDGRYSQRKFSMASVWSPGLLGVPENNPFYVNPTSEPGPVFLFYNFADDLGNPMLEGTTEGWSTDLGFDLDLSATWRVTAYGAYASEKARSSSPLIDDVAVQAGLDDSDPATAFNPFADGSNTNPDTLRTFTALQRDWFDSNVKSANVTADGPLFSLPGGLARLAIGADYRDEQLNSTRTREELGRDVAATFAELALPLLAPIESMPGRPLLSLSIAGRYEEYSDFGSTFNPKVGFRLSPLQALSFRGSWGTSFRAPRLYELSTSAVGGTSANSITPLPDPATGGFAVALVRSGNNPELNEETADTWTLGIDLAAGEQHSVITSLTYYDINYKDRIIKPGPAAPSQLLVQEGLWPEIINRTPTQDQLAELCAQVSRGSCAATPPTVIVDQRLRNIANLRVKGVDASVDWPLATSFGDWRFGLNGTYVLTYEQKLSGTAPSIDLLNVSFNPVDFRLRAAVVWTLGGLSADLAANYTDGYKETLSPTSRKVDSWTTIDAGIAYEFGSRTGLTDQVTIAARAVNLFDEDPPFVDVPLGFDSANAAPLGRLLSLQISKQW